MLINRIPASLEGAITRELEQGEKVFWKEPPLPRYFTPGTIATMLFAIPWTAFSVFWMWGASQAAGETPVGIVFPLFGIPFVLVGLGMLSAPLWNYRKARRTAYVITARRAIVFQGGRSLEVRSYGPEQLRELYRRERTDGSGDIILDTREWTGSKGRTRREELGFMSVRNVREVERILKTVAEGA